MAETEVKTLTLTSNKSIVTEGITKPAHYEEIGDGYVVYDDKLIRKEALRELRPDLFTAKADALVTHTNFGTAFPRYAHKGDMFVRVDILPNKVFKFDGKKWIEVNKNMSGSYLENSYLQFLVDRLSAGEYDLDMLTETERSELETFLRSQSS